MKTLPEVFDLPEWAKDAVHVISDVHLGFWDRLRVLFGAVVNVRTTTFCEHEPGRAESKAQTFVYFEHAPTIQLGTVEVAPKESVTDGK